MLKYLKYTPMLYFEYNRNRSERKKTAYLHDPQTFNNSFCSLGRGQPLPITDGGHGRIAPLNPQMGVGWRGNFPVTQPTRGLGERRERPSRVRLIRISVLFKRHRIPLVEMFVVN